MAQAAIWQLLFVVRGARAEEVEALAERGVVALRGVRAADVAELVADAMEPVLKPLLAPEVVDAAHGYRAQGHRVYIVSTALQEIVDAIVADLGLDGGIGTVCEVVDGRYTGRALRPLHGEGEGGGARRARRRASRSISPPRPRTPTATPTCRSSRRSAIPSSSIRTVRCGRSRASAAGRCSTPRRRAA